MTPDLSTPEGRAELRAYYPPGGTLNIDAHMNAALDALDVSEEREAALSREIIALRADLDSALISVSNAECRIDDLEATIERLTAPATEGEGFDAAYHGDSLTGFDDASDMREVLDAFIARRKEATP